MPPVAAARLVEDAGEAAAEPDHFFRSPQFLAAEGVTHSLLVEGEDVSEALPLIVREIPGADGADAISPYGYPGAARPPAQPPEPEQVDFSQTGLVSAFVRDRIGADPCFAGGTVRSLVQIADPARESGVRKRLREQVRRNRRRGWSLAAIHGPATSDQDRAAFARAYAQTMARVDAPERYLYDEDYFRAVLSFERSWLFLATLDEGEPAAGAIAGAGDGYLHYYLGGTADEALTDSPMKNLFTAMIEQATELGLPLNLGGGVSPGDSLDRFKQGFANLSAEWRTHEIVCDEAAYRRLSGQEPGGEGFFPAYRAP